MSDNDQTLPDVRSSEEPGTYRPPRHPGSKGWIQCLHEAKVQACRSVWKMLSDLASGDCENLLEVEIHSSSLLLKL